MSMTPLQAIAATKFVSTTADPSLSAHRMDIIMSDYLLNPLTAAIKNAIENVSYIDTDGSTVVYPLVDAASHFPEACGVVRVGDRVTAGEGLDVPGFETTDDIKTAMVGYANHILCNGDVGKFASLVDKVSGLMTAVGDVTAVIEKAQTMKFEDFGPGVKNFGGAINMGIDGMSGAIEEAIQKANNGQLPVIQGVPPTPAATVGTVLVAQGEVSGPPDSPEYGSAIGIYQSALSKGLTEEIDAIHQEFLKQPVPLNAKISKTSGKYIRPTAVTNMTEAQFNELMDLTYAAAVEDEASANEEERLEAVQVKLSVDVTREKGYTAFMEKVHKVVINIMNDPSKYRQDPFLEVVIKMTIESETHMREAIDGLDLGTAKKLFSKLGSKIQVEKLEKYTDILDVGKASAAMPPPLTDKTAPMVVKTTAAPPVEDPVSGELTPQPLPITQNLSTPTDASAPAIAAASAPATNPWIGVDAEKSLAWSKLSPAEQKYLGKADPTDPAILARAATGSTSIPGLSAVTSKLSSGFPNMQISGAAFGGGDLPKTGDAGFDAIGAQALGAVGNIKLNLTDLGTKAGQERAASDMKAVGANFGQIKGFDNVQGTKSLGNMLRSVETSLPVPRGLLGSLTQPVTVTDADIEEARKLKSNAADIAAGKPPAEWNVTPEQYVRNSKLNKALTPTLLNNFKSVMPPNIKEELQTAVGVGTGAGGSYSLLDFIGSAVGENGQVENWQIITRNCTVLWEQYEEELAPLISDMLLNADELYDYSQFTNLLDQMYASGLGEELVSYYDDSINKIHAEYDRLITIAGVDFASLPSGDLTSKLNLSKKLAQHAHKLDSGHAAVFQNAANPESEGGQAILGVMVEARNTKLLNNIGFNPVNSISKPTKTVATEEDRAEAAKINAKSGDPDGITAEQVARNRSLNNTLKGLFGIK